MALPADVLHHPADPNHPLAMPAGVHFARHSAVPTPDYILSRCRTDTLGSQVRRRQDAPALPFEIRRAPTTSLARCAVETPVTQCTCKVDCKLSLVPTQPLLHSRSLYRGSARQARIWSSDREGDRAVELAERDVPREGRGATSAAGWRWARGPGEASTGAY